MIHHHHHHHPLGIQDLPFELLPEIVQWLDFNDVLSLRQTTKAFREATDTTTVWRALANSYAARYCNAPRPEHGPISALSRNELIEWTWRRYAIERAWTNKEAPLHHRHVPLSIGDDDVWSTSTLLVPGGRWLIIGFNNGTIDYLDLDSEQPSQRGLIRPIDSLPVDLQIADQLDISLSPKTPSLEFTLVTTSSRRDYLVNTPFWTHFWHIKLQGQGPSATLEASYLSSFCSFGLGMIDKISLNGDLLARVRYRNCQYWLEVFRWRECSAKVMMMSTIFVGSPIESIKLIGNHKVLVLFAEKAAIYDIPPMNQVNVWRTTEPNDGIHSEPIWWCTFPGRYGDCSRLYFDGITYRLTVMTSGLLIDLRIPASNDASPITHVSLNINKPWGLGATGLYRAILYHETAPHVRYRWDTPCTGEKSRSVKSTRVANRLEGLNFDFDSEEEPNSWYFGTIHLDEERGRIVCTKTVSWTHEELFIQDFVL